LTSFSGANITTVSSEAVVRTVVKSIVGAIGIVQSEQDSTIGEFEMLIDPTGTGELMKVGASVQHMLNCLIDTFDPVTLQTNTVASKQQCWPAHIAVKLLVHSSYTGTGCEKGNETLSFVKWMHTSENLALALKQRNIARNGDIPFVRDAIVKALNAIECDGETLQIVLPIIWNMSPALTSFGYAASIIGIILCVAIQVIILICRDRVVFKSSSSLFLLIILTGIILMFVSSMLLTTTPSVENCSSFVWTACIGFTLVFGPLFAKTWRIYRNKQIHSVYSTCIFVFLIN
jgi:hypothetical protein